MELLRLLFSLKRAFLSRAVSLFFFPDPVVRLPEPVPPLSRGEEVLLAELLDELDEEEEEDDDDDDFCEDSSSLIPMVTVGTLEMVLQGIQRPPFLR